MRYDDMSDEPKELTAEHVAKEMQVHISRVYQWIQIHSRIHAQDVSL